METLIPASDKKAICFPHFPDNYLLVIWLNWGLIETERIARVLDAECEWICDAAALMGLERRPPINTQFAKRGYISIINSMWHLLEYDQICTLLNWTPQELALTLKEDDFLWVKLGSFKPAVERPVYRKPDAEMLTAMAQIRRIIASYDDIIGDIRPNEFEFADELSGNPPDVGEREHIIAAAGGSFKIIYSYCTLFGDALLEPELDPFPDAMLARYSMLGINGIWMHALLNTLAPFLFAEEYSQDWEKRLETLNMLVERAGRYGIGIYLYLNEPRSMPLAFYEKWSHLKGHRNEGSEFASLCTSTREVQDYLDNSVRCLFTHVRNLAGIITITRSENQTNCYSHASSPDNCTCPVCRNIPVEDVIAGVNNAIMRGIRKAGSNARLIAWNWGWDWTGKVKEIIEKHDEEIIIQATSETDLPFRIGGVEGIVCDYSISLPGPGPLAKKTWEHAISSNHQTSAKVQVNNTWEASGVPYIPVFDLVAEHISNVRACGVENLHLSWTLGGSPSPMLGMACYMLNKPTSGLDDVHEYLKEAFPEGESVIVYNAQKQFCEAFREFPFHINVLYLAPQNLAQKTYFFPEPTGYTATMVGFPYDDVKSWAAIYPEDVFENQFRLLCEKWADGFKGLKEHTVGASKAFEEFVNVSEGCLLTFRETYNIIRFTRARNENLKNPSETLTSVMLEAVSDDEQNVLATIRLRSRDSRIGYEASNHYYYTLQNLKDKLINLNYVKTQLSKS